MSTIFAIRFNVANLQGRSKVFQDDGRPHAEMKFASSSTTIVESERPLDASFGLKRLQKHLKVNFGGYAWSESQR